MILRIRISKIFMNDAMKTKVHDVDSTFIYKFPCQRFLFLPFGKIKIK